MLQRYKNKGVFRRRSVAGFFLSKRDIFELLLVLHSNQHCENHDHNVQREENEEVQCHVISPAPQHSGQDKASIVREDVQSIAGQQFMVYLELMAIS